MMQFIRKHYGVPAKRGLPVAVEGKRGVITGSCGSHLKIRIDGETKSRKYHPTWRIEYLEGKELNHATN